MVCDFWINLDQYPHWFLIDQRFCVACWFVSICAFAFADCCVRSWREAWPAVITLACTPPRSHVAIPLVGQSDAEASGSGTGTGPGECSPSPPA